MADKKKKQLSYNAIKKRLKAHAAKGRNFIEAAANNTENIYRSARDEIDRLVYKHVYYERSPFAGKRYQQLYEEMAKVFAGFEEKILAELKKPHDWLVTKAFQDAVLTADQPDITAGISKAYIKDSFQDAFSHVAGATRKLQDDEIWRLRKLAADTIRKARLTGMTRSQVAKEMLINAGGNFRFIDASGRKWTKPAYFNMLSRTLLHNSSRSAYLDGLAKNNQDVVRISVSGNPCPDCAKWENRLVSVSGKTQGLPLLQDAIREGLFHPNCTHRLIAVPSYIQQRDYNTDGRPHRGLNNPKQPIKNDKEAWSQYRKQQNDKRREKENNKYISALPEHFTKDKTTRQEKEAIINYTSSSDDINLYAIGRYKGTEVEKIKQQVYNIDKAISKGKAKKNVYLYRGLKDPNIITMLKLGSDKIDAQSFQSTSRSRAISKSFATNEGCLLKVKLNKSTNCLNIEDWSEFPHEQEVILPRGGFFKVEKVDFNKKPVVAEVTYHEPAK